MDIDIFSETDEGDYREAYHYLGREFEKDAKNLENSDKSFDASTHSPKGAENLKFINPNLQGDLGEKLNRNHITQRTLSDIEEEK